MKGFRMYGAQAPLNQLILKASYSESCWGFASCLFSQGAFPLLAGAADQRAQGTFGSWGGQAGGEGLNEV